MTINLTVGLAAGNNVEHFLEVETDTTVVVATADPNNTYSGLWVTHGSDMVLPDFGDMANYTFTCADCNEPSFIEDQGTFQLTPADNKMMISTEENVDNNLPLPQRITYYMENTDLIADQRDTIIVDSSTEIDVYGVFGLQSVGVRKNGIFVGTADQITAVSTTLEPAEILEVSIFGG